MSVHVFGDAIIPGATYEVEALDLACHFSAPGESSPALTLSTASVWGDIVGTELSDPPEGTVTMIDVSAVIDRFAGLAGALSTLRTDLEPHVPNQSVTFMDVSAALDALHDFGRPKVVRLAVLIDRGGRELPVAADFVGRRVDAPAGTRVQLRLMENDGKEGAYVIPKNA